MNSSPDIIQKFGNVWTEAKLKAVERYLAFYTNALKNIKFNLCYIDAFAGSGSIRIKSGYEIEGSAMRALKYPFDKYIFLDTNQQAIRSLKRRISELDEHRAIDYRSIDCNSYFTTEIEKEEWKKGNWRGVIFLDPFAMNLEWSCLEHISNTEVFDVWYFFPFMAVNRNLNKNGKIKPANKETLNRILGTEDWENHIYSKSPQLSFLDDDVFQKANVEDIKTYILNRLKQTFPTVSENPVLLSNERKSPQFLLCFAGSNPSSQAKKLSLKAADHILKHM